MSDEITDHVIELRDVEYSIGGRAVLRDIDLAVKKGEVVILLGESGCGKTTTLKLINRLIDPTGGKILVDGVDTATLDPIELRRRIGYVMQEGGLFPHMTVAENVATVLDLLGRADHAARVSEMLDLVGLDPSRFAERYPNELSGGQRQRVGVARALAAEPEMILLDEPFGALDALTRTALQKEFARLVRELGKTAVFVTHDLHEAFTLGDRIALMDGGKIEFLGTPETFRLAENELAREYLKTLL